MNSINATYKTMFDSLEEKAAEIQKAALEEPENKADDTPLL